MTPAQIPLYSELEPLEFCDKWLGLDSLPSEEATLQKGHGYRSRCNRLLSEVFGLSPNTVRQWGSGFRRMPKKHRAKLGKLLFYRKIEELHLTCRHATTCTVQIIFSGGGF
ncbi:MAG: hypothetical protein F6J89_18180 [Symploca sp. SIO1C4]|uniref:Uncharacterized protein n=1 Tax=Symploca sp. SIO1C4 TaxID=2607765 RepID=A0A6B3NHJ9_9CYAN|nr:hypothetical protein [Symploca sp. SIO1C4]